MKKKEYYEYDPEEGKLAPIKDNFKMALKKVDKWGILKKAVGMVASGCASVVVSKYLKANMPPTESMVDKAVMGIGMYFITGVVGRAVAKHAEEDMDEFKDILTIEEAADDGNIVEA